MNPIFALVFLFAVANAATTEQSKDGQPTKLSDAIIAKYGEQPCLNKVIGQRLVHPTDPHKFLRCMSLEALWIETCPDGLFYNPSMELCDWSSKPRPTTHSNEVVKNRPVLFKTKLTDSGVVQSEVVEHVDTRKMISDEPVRAVEPVREQVREMETTTVSLLDELRKKLNLDTTERPTRLVEEEIPRKSLRLLEALPEEKKSSRVLEINTEDKKSSRELDASPEEKKSSRVLDVSSEEKKSSRELDASPEEKKSSRVLDVSSEEKKSSRELEANQEERSSKSERSEKSEKSSQSERSEEELSTERRPSLRLIEVPTEESSKKEQREFDVQSKSPRLFLKSIEKKSKQPEA
jgi:hypothetical protein